MLHLQRVCRESEQDKDGMTFLEAGQGGCEDMGRDNRDYVRRGSLGCMEVCIQVTW
jgi:hypothetical protein